MTDPLQWMVDVVDRIESTEGERKMRDWQTRLTEPQRAVVQEIVDQLPTTMGYREAFEGVLDSLVSGPRMTGVQLYAEYTKEHETQGCSVERFEELEPADRIVWDNLAQRIYRRPAFRFVIVTDADVRGTDDEVMAREIASDEDSFVIDMVTGLWITEPRDEGSAPSPF